MAKKSIKIKQPIIRVCQGSAKVIIDNNIKGAYYFQNKEGKYVVVDNTKGKIKLSEYDTIEECMESLI